MVRQKETKRRKFLAALLVMAVLITVQGNFIWADSPDQTEAIDATGTESIANPMHNCTMENDTTGNTDTTNWSYLYFGSYPQTEVTGSALTSDITDAAYDANGDALVNGVKYRRISRDDANSGSYFGESDYRYFKWENIKWRILDSNDSTLFLAADQGLDCKNYHGQFAGVTWENSDIRTWLNGTFYNTAFSSNDQGAIVSWNVTNDSNADYGTSGGNTTSDKIYLLSVGEVTNPNYGFCEDGGQNSASRRYTASAYANAMGAGSSASGSAGNCFWWLRSPGYNASYASYINSYGYIYQDGASVNYSNSAVVPVLHVNRGYVEDPYANPQHHCTMSDDGSDITDWSYLYFGTYPQSEVTGEELTSSITGAAYDTNGDALVNGVKYRRISREDTNSTNNFGNGTYRYFKWEAVKWRLLWNDGSTVFVAADSGIDCKNYNSTSDAVTWETCGLRTWLNDNFYSMAFNTSEQGAIIDQTISNEANSEYAIYGGESTKDKVFLLSISESMNANYGFCEDITTYSASRWMKASAYAYAMGAGISTGSRYAGNCSWWLRSPGRSSDYAAYGQTYGSVSVSGASISSSNCAVVPAMYIKLSYFTGDTGKSEGSSDSSNSSNTNAAQQPAPGSTNITTSSRLSAPKLTIKLQSASSVKLSWNKISGAAGYNIYRAIGKNGNYSKLKTTTGTAYTDKKLKKGKTYYYRIDAYNAASVSAKSGAVSRKILGKPATPKQNKLKVNASGMKFTISWKKSNNASKVIIYRRVDSGKFKKWKTVAAKKLKATYSYKSYARGHRYSFQLRSYYKKDGVTVYSGYSNIYTLIM